MDDKTANGSSEAPKKSRNNKKVTLTFTLSTITKVVIAVVIAAVLIGIYMLGVKNGEGKSGSSSTDRSSSAVSTASKRWSQIGSITEINDKKLKVKDTKGEEEIFINDETTITGTDGKKTDIKALKKDQRVIATGTKDDKGVQTATRIRIQK